MNQPQRTEFFSGCLLYALATLPLTALVITIGAWLARLGAWAGLWSEAANALCCAGMCAGVALPLGIVLYSYPLRRGTIGHHVVQMTDHRGLALLDICLLVGALTVTLVSLLLLPPTNLVVYLPAVATLVAVGARWALRNLTLVVPFDKTGQGADLGLLGQQSHLTADEIRDYNHPPRSLRISPANAAGPLGQVQSGSWRLEFKGVTMQATKDPAWLVMRLTGLVTNLSAVPASLETLPKLTVRDARGNEVSPRQVAAASLTPEARALSSVDAGAGARLTLAFDVAAAQQELDLMVRSGELTAGEEVLVPL